MYGQILQQLHQSGNLRTLPAGNLDDTATIDLTTNDYLGLGNNPILQQEFMYEAHGKSIPLTSSASRLLASGQKHYTELESYLSDLYGQKALLFNSGYHANTGIISALAGIGHTLVVADKLVHASIIDGIVLSKAPFTRFLHNDFDRLERILQKERQNYERIIVVVESVYSMDGDSPDLERLIEIKKRHPGTMLYVDEAHALGVCGPNGLGLCAATHHTEQFDVIIGTLGKACASMGAFAITSDEVRNFLINKARSLIFSTALPPIQAAWTKFVLQRIVGMDSERAHLKDIGLLLQKQLQPLSAHSITPSHIQPFIVGSPQKAVALSETLAKEHFKVLPIRVPTVPPGTDRLRISLSATLSHSDITHLGQTLGEILNTDTASHK